MHPDFYWSLNYWLDEFVQLWRRQPKQMWFQLIVSLVGLAAFWNTYRLIVQGASRWAPLNGLALTLLIFMVLVSMERRRYGEPYVFNRGQSYLFMAGPWLVPHMFGVAALGWKYHAAEIPVWMREWWVFWVVGPTLLVVVAVVFHFADTPRYWDASCGSMLKSPSKWWLNRWQMPILVTLVLIAVVPTWWTSGRERWISMAMVCVCILLGLWDDRRKLNPRNQHVKWDPRKFARVL